MEAVVEPALPRQGGDLPADRGPAADALAGPGRASLPDVAAKLDPQGRWTKAAEQALLRVEADPAGGHHGRAPPSDRPDRHRHRGGAGAGRGDRPAPGARGRQRGRRRHQRGQGGQSVAAAIGEQYGTRAKRREGGRDGRGPGRGAGARTPCESSAASTSSSPTPASCIAGEITEFPAEKWRTVIEVNLFGYFLVRQARGASVMKEQTQRRHHPDQLASRARRAASRTRPTPPASSAASA